MAQNFDYQKMEILSTFYEWVCGTDMVSGMELMMTADMDKDGIFYEPAAVWLHFRQRYILFWYGGILVPVLDGLAWFSL